MSRILVAGGTGFIGSALVESLLDEGHQVSVLGRDAGRIRMRFGSRARAIVWGKNDVTALGLDISGFDVVVNLTGEQAVGTRYTSGKKQRIRDSRVKITRDLVEAFERAKVRPKLFISASAVGYYGAATPTSPVDESGAIGSGFLAELCHEWESAASRAEMLGIRVILVRLGVVLGPKGGAFEAMARPFRLGVGGRIGNGRQGFSFISLVDCVAAIKFLMKDTDIRGPVNLTAPAPTDGAGVAVALGRVLGKPNWLPVPRWALRGLYGEGAEALDSGPRVIPQVLLAQGFHFQHPNIDSAVAAAAGLG
jgi:uncharacterized protein (TIGR01777 family)